MYLFVFRHRLFFTVTAILLFGILSSDLFETADLIVKLNSY